MTVVGADGRTCHCFGHRVNYGPEGIRTFAAGTLKSCELTELSVWVAAFLRKKKQAYLVPPGNNLVMESVSTRT